MQAKPSLQDDRYTDPHRWWILAACSVVAFALLAEPHLWMIGFDIPSSAFGSAWREYRLLANFGVVLFVAFQLVGGVLGDLVGRRRIFLIGAIGATLGNLLSLLAPDLLMLTIARGLTGMLGALVFPLTLGIIRLNFAGDERTRALMIFSFVTSLGALAALIGISINYWFGWRWTFVLPISAGLVGVGLAWRYLPESKAQGGFWRLEAITAAAWALVLLAVMFGMVFARGLGTLLNPITLAAGGAGLIGLLVVILWTQYATSKGLFKNRQSVPQHFLLMLLLISATISFGLLGYGVQLYTFFFNVQQLGPIVAGIAMVPIVLGNAFVLRPATRFVIVQPTYIVLGSGLSAMALAALLTAMARPTTPYLLLVLPMMLFGLGFLMASVSWSYFFFAALPRDLVGLSSGINRAAGSVGMALAGVVLASVVYVTGTADFITRMAAFGLEEPQQELALTVVDTALRQGVGAGDLSQTPASLTALGLAAAYREAYSVGISGAMLTVAGVCFACAVVAWFWIRGIYREGSVSPDKPSLEQSMLN